jgi:hypothetical protein
MVRITPLPEVRRASTSTSTSAPSAVSTTSRRVRSGAAGREFAPRVGVEQRHVTGVQHVGGVLEQRPAGRVGRAVRYAAHDRLGESSASTRS